MLPLAVRCRLAFLAGVAEITGDPEGVRRALARYPGDPVTVAGVSTREELWSLILDRLPPGWRAAQPSYDPGRRLWSIAALGPKRGGRHGPPPESVVGEGADELAALEDLARKLA